VRLGFEEFFRLPGQDGSAGYIGLRRGTAELAVTTEASPRELWGVEAGPGPRHELFIYVERLDDIVTELRDAGVVILREPQVMFWGERLAVVRDPEGNLVSLAAAGDVP
jgi:lactoylglutathione lyase